MVVPCHHKHPTIGRGPIGIPVFQRIAGTVHPRTFAIPQAKDRLACFMRVGFHLLGADHLCGPELFVHGW